MVAGMMVHAMQTVTSLQTKVLLGPSKHQPPPTLQFQFLLLLSLQRQRMLTIAYGSLVVSALAMAPLFCGEHAQQESHGSHFPHQCHLPKWFGLQVYQALHSLYLVDGSLYFWISNEVTAGSSWTNRRARFQRLLMNCPLRREDTPNFLLQPAQIFTSLVVRLVMMKPAQA
jgi:hypothetical protein